MKKLPLFFIVFFFFSQSRILHSQNLEWVQHLEGGYNHPISIERDGAGNLIMVGYLDYSIDVDLGPGVNNISNTHIGYHDIFILKFDANGNILWYKTISGSTDQQVNALAIDNNDNIYLTGFFWGTVDFDPGPGTSNLNSLSFGDAFVLKLDPAGNFMWAKDIGGSSTTEEGKAIAIDNAGNVYWTGTYGTAIDLDPGPGTYTITSSGGTAIAFLCKYDLNGNFVWGRRLPRISVGLVLDQNQNPIIAGEIHLAFDFDPGAGTYNLGGTGIDTYIYKLTTDGNFLWVKSFAAYSGTTVPMDFNQDNDGNLYVSGGFTDSVDFNPGPGVDVHVSNGWQTDGFVVKLDSNANLIWAKTTGGTSGESFMSSSIDDYGNVYTCGWFLSDPGEFDPGIGSYFIPLNGVTDIFVQKLKPTGDFVWAYGMGDTLGDRSYSLTTDGEDIFVTGVYEQSMDADPDTGITLLSASYASMFLQKISSDSCDNITLNILTATDVTCTSNGEAIVYGDYGLAPYTYQWNTVPPDNDSIGSFTNGGIYSVQLQDANGCTKNTAIAITQSLYPTDYDFTTNLVTNNFRPGTLTNIWLDAYNNGCTGGSGQLIFVLDTIVSFISSSPTPDYISGDTLIWNFTGLAFDDPHFIPHVVVTTNTWANVGDSVHLNCKILPMAGDQDTINNNKIYHFPVLNGYDPNDKKIYPTGACNAGYLLNDEVITYTIRFQNTGNSDAINIFVLDTLDTNLDLNSVRIVGNSHPMITEVLPGNVLKFRFDNIMLPDSNLNEPLSHGYVIFEVIPDTGIANNTPIENTSHIFFDFNPVVVTNTVANTLVSSIPNTNSSVSQTFCNSTVINGYSYNSSGIFIQHFNNYLGCDSTIILNLTMLDSSSNYITAASCYNYTFNSITYNSSGIYYQTLTNSLGCDSLITLDLTILDSTSNIITTSACDSYTLNSITYNSSGIYSQTFTNSGGCDSTLFLDLTIHTIDNSVSQFGHVLTANELSATYQWIDCNNSNQPISGATNQSYTAIVNGDYAVIVTANGCTDTSACQSVFGFGIEDQNFSSGLSASPNPTHSYINIQSKLELKNATLIVTDINGKNLLQKNELNGNSFQFDLSELNSGMYFFHICSEGKEGIVKVVKS